jgi:macrolide transport system ATP-binding/permease protein
MPRWVNTFRLGLRSLFFKADVERELDAELRYHFEREVEERRAAGVPDDEAGVAARRSMGAVTQNMEACRDMRGLNVIDHAMQDLRFALRQLGKNPGFACTAILVLTLGIGASATIFGYVDAALVRPLPYEAPSRLVHVFGTRPESVQNQDRGGVSYQDLRDWRERSRAFHSMAAYDVRAGFNLTTPEGPERVSGLRVTSGFFRTLGVAPILGRDFRDDEEGPSAPATVMLSYGTWQSRFGADPAVLGRTVSLQFPWLAGGEPHVVIGVLPPELLFPMAAEADFWATIRGQQACWDVRSCQSLESIARLADDVSPEAASANLTAVMAQLRAEYPEHHREPAVAKIVGLPDVMLGDIQPILLMLLGAAGLLWLIASMNGVSLILARSETRRREVAVRNALGASSRRLTLQFGTEALVLATLSGALGLLLASWSMRVLTSLMSADMIARMPYFRNVGMNLRVVIFAGVLSTIVGLVLGLIPLVRTSTSETLAGLKEGSRGSAGTMWRRAGAPLVVAELAIAMILLVGAGLLGKSLYRLLHVDPGFNVQQLALLSVSPVSVASGSPDGNEQSGRLAQEVAERVAAVPGVMSVGYADLSPLGPGLAPASTLWVAGRAEHRQLKDSAPIRRVSAGYFKALQATLLRGREFAAADLTAVRPVMIINNTAAQRYFPSDDPIGRLMAFGGPDSPLREIIGIVDDIKDGPPEAPAYPAAYVPFDQSAFTLLVRTGQADHAVLPSVVTAVHEVQRGLLVGGQTTMTEQMNRLPSTSLNRSSAWLVGGFACVAFVLGVVGLYGVVSYTVGQRTREIGVRIALGARRRSVYRLVLGDAGRLVSLGIALGLAAAVALATLMRHVLFGVESWDPATLVVVSTGLIVSGLLASYLPARRAASVNPIEVLRAE